MASRYWVVSLPVQQNSSTTSLWSRLQESISRHSFDTPLYRFNIPNLRVGTLDSLLALSDDLVKSNSFIEGVCSKTRRQIEELERVSGVLSSSLTVDGVPVDSYLTRFAWDEAKYPTMSPLKEIVDGIHSQVAKIEDDLKVRVSEYNNVRSQLNAINRKQTGSLAVRDLSNLVKPTDVVTSEHLTTLLAVVSNYSQKDWLSSYETLTTYVVPRSSKMLYEDNEYALYTVTLFNRDADNFKIKARERGFQIRDFEHNPETQESRKQELEKLMQDQETFRSSLLQWCYTSYGEMMIVINHLEMASSKEASRENGGEDWRRLQISATWILVRILESDIKPNRKYKQYQHVREYEGNWSSQRANLTRDIKCLPRVEAFSSTHFFHMNLLSFQRQALGMFPFQGCGIIICPAIILQVFSSWMHFCAVRIFAESILRYGLPPSFLSVVLAPSIKSEKKVRSILESLCDSSNSNFWKADDEGGMAGFGGDTEAHPYVSFTINLV
ncbi:hypothetical protein MTR67_014384 [Solanum verrucosum]|uniref:V-type proton ATPase subunit C n=1 Tax=Solanum verrucosum TaxID=315347 RepID=A0AAF0QC42_SOLVR|nr:hypothetical protein MTR67_014384 [Solanum verrucosum]